MVRLGEDLADDVESKVAAYGRGLLEEVFASDANAALDDRTKNPGWTELVRRAGGPTLRIGKRTLYVALRIAAYAFEPMVMEALRAGRLRRVLEAYAPTVPGYLIYFPNRAQRSPPLRQFVEAAKELAVTSLS